MTTTTRSRRWTRIVAAFVTTAAIAIAPSNAHAAEWFDIVDVNASYQVGDTVKLKYCWKTAKPTKLRVKADGDWRTVDKATVKKRPNSCASSTRVHEHRYRYRITRNDVENGKIRVAITNGRGNTKRNFIFLDSQVAPASPNWNPSDPSTWTAQEDRYAQDIVQTLALLSPEQQLGLCRELSSNSFLSSIQNFYNEVARRGVQDFGVDAGRARVLVPYVFDVACRVQFGISVPKL